VCDGEEPSAKIQECFCRLAARIYDAGYTDEDVLFRALTGCAADSVARKVFRSIGLSPRRLIELGTDCPSDAASTTEELCAGCQLQEGFCAP